MSSPTAPAIDAANAVAQAIGRILLAMLDAIFGDISGLAPRHPIRSAHARAQRHIARYVAALAAALATPAEESSGDVSLTPAPLTPAPRPPAIAPQRRPAASPIAHPRPPAARQARPPPQAPPQKHPLPPCTRTPFLFRIRNINRQPPPPLPRVGQSALAAMRECP